MVVGYMNEEVREPIPAWWCRGSCCHFRTSAHSSSPPLPGENWGVLSAGNLGLLFLLAAHPSTLLDKESRD